MDSNQVDGLQVVLQKSLLAASTAAVLLQDCLAHKDWFVPLSVREKAKMQVSIALELSHYLDDIYGQLCQPQTAT